jgi:hypothetical protein
MASGSVLQTSEEQNKICAIWRPLPPIKRSAWNHLKMLGSDEEFMLFWGFRGQRSECYYVLLIWFGDEEGSTSFSLQMFSDSLCTG